MDPTKSVTVTYLGNSRTLNKLLKVELIQELSLAIYPPRYAEEDLPEEWLLPPPRKYLFDDGAEGEVIDFHPGTTFEIH
jgi:hypothetical protein